ncbi:hypothetical protein E4U58_007374 [Claviceps cyperi]|nr:hypothetical protein E4U58_007374 [Claviceps cyperi]
MDFRNNPTQVSPDIQPSQEFGGSLLRGPGFGPENDDDEYEFGDVAVPNLLAKQDDLSALRDGVGDGLPLNATPGLPQLSIRPYLSIQGRTVAELDERATDSELLSLTFPSLYPYGKADWWSARLRKVSFKEYIQYLLLYGRAVCEALEMEVHCL